MKKADWLIIGAAAALSLLSLLPLAGPGEAKTVTVTDHGETVYSGSLSTDAVVTLPGNVVEIRDGAVTMAEANCPDGACQKGGPATAFHPIVCLPNQVIVTVAGEEVPELDGVAY